MLQISNLKKYFGGVKAVDGCSFEIKPNSITALIGPNGSGKSTLFNLVSGIITPDSGKIVFNKQDITSLPIEQISNKGISRLFQQSRLFSNLTIEENLKLATNQEDTKFWKNFLGLNKDLKNIDPILKLVQMYAHKDKKTSELSFGQKRLTEIARSILNPHKLLMLDEPVAGVNPQLRNTIAKIIKQLKKQGDTILLIEHDMNFTLSGGQQQMLAIARALIQNPQLLLLDEPSLGLSPKAMKEVFKIIKKINQEGISVIIVEQNAKQAVEIADTTYILEDGKIALKGKKDILKNKKIKDIYFGGR